MSSRDFPFGRLEWARYYARGAELSHFEENGESDEAGSPRSQHPRVENRPSVGIRAEANQGTGDHFVSTEFGVRMALGANRVDLLTLVFLEGAKVAGAGLVLGVASSLAATRILTGLLYGIEPTDRFSFGIASGLLVLVAAAATYIPARRASRLNPTLALRAE